MVTGEDECDESLYWIVLLVESGNVIPSRVSALFREGEEILRMVVTSVNTARRSRQSAIRNPQSAIG